MLIWINLQNSLEDWYSFISITTPCASIERLPKERKGSKDVRAYLNNCYRIFAEKRIYITKHWNVSREWWKFYKGTSNKSESRQMGARFPITQISSCRENVCVSTTIRERDVNWSDRAWTTRDLGPCTVIHREEREVRLLAGNTLLCACNYRVERKKPYYLSCNNIITCKFNATD